jgi:hypothetical protein
LFSCADSNIASFKQPIDDELQHGLTAFFLNAKNLHVGGRVRSIFSFLVILLAFAPQGKAQSASSDALKTPNVSANGLFLYRNSNFSKEDTSTERNGLDLQEAELAFYSDVDPYSRFSLLMSLHPNYELDGATGKVTQSWIFEPEEAFAELTQVPSTNVKIGKFKAAFGKSNLLHTHAYPFVDAPIINTQLMGDEGLNDVGVSAAVLLPINWFSEVTLQYLRGEGENKEFNSPTPGDGVELAHWKNLWDLSDALTFETGLSYAQGGNSLGTMTSLSGADVTFKWRPTSGGKYKSWVLAAEYIDRKVPQPGADDEKGQGYNIWGQYQFAERWAALLRYENLKVEGADRVDNPLALANQTTTKTSASVVFAASEFSSYRIEYDWVHGPTNAEGNTNEQKLYLQANFTIGSHPAHSY